MSTSIKVITAEVLGILFLWIPCLLQAWTAATVPSTKPYPAGLSPADWTTLLPPHRPVVDTWRWSFLRNWYANNEDGVSGQQAYIWQGATLVPYASTFPSWVPRAVIAYAWSALRNGAHAIKLATGVDPPVTSP
jgi:hypothetical protein